MTKEQLEKKAALELEIIESYLGSLKSAVARLEDTLERLQEHSDDE